MARSYGNSMSDDPRAVIERALRAARDRAPSNEGSRAVPMWNEYQADREPYRNRPWRPTPYSPRDVPPSSNLPPASSDDEVIAQALSAARSNLPPSSFGSAESDWMAPGLLQYAALNAALAQRGIIGAIAPTFARVGQPETWPAEREAPVDRQPARSTFADREEAIDDIADLERAVQEVEDMENAAVTRGLAMDFQPNMTAAQMAALSTLGREPTTAVANTEDETVDTPAEEAPSFAAPSMPAEFSGRAAAAEQAAREQAAFEAQVAEDEARDMEALGETAAARAAPSFSTVTRSEDEADRAAERSLGLREVDIPGFIAEQMGRMAGMPSWAVNREVDDFMGRPAIATVNPEEFDVPAPALEQAIAANIAAMTGRTPSSVVASLPNVEEAIAAAVEDDLAGVQAANMEMADIEESQAQALAAMQAFAAQNALAMEQGLPGLSYAPQAPAFAQVETPNISYNPQAPAIDVPMSLPAVGLVNEPQAMPTYYTPNTLPAVNEEIEPQAMGLYAPIETPNLTYAPMPLSIMQAIYEEEAAKTVEEAQRALEDVDRIGQDLGRPTPTPTFSNPAVQPQGINALQNDLRYTPPAPRSFRDPNDIVNDYRSRNRTGIDEERVDDLFSAPITVAPRSQEEETAPNAPVEREAPAIEDAPNFEAPANPFSAPLGTMPAIDQPAQEDEETGPPANEMEDLNNSFMESMAVANAPVAGVPGLAGMAIGPVAGMMGQPGMAQGLMASLGLPTNEMETAALSYQQANQAEEAEESEDQQGFENSFSNAFSAPNDFGPMGGMASGLAGTSLGAAPAGMEGLGMSAPADVSGSFGGVGLGTAATETSAGQMSSLGLEGMFSNAFADPMGFAAPGIDVSSFSSETDDAESSGLGGLGVGPSDVGTSDTSASAASDSSSDSSSSDSGAGGPSGDGGGGGGGSGDGTSGDAGSSGGFDGTSSGGYDSGTSSGGFDGSSDTGGAGWASGGYIPSDRAILRAILAAERLHDRDRKARGGYVMPFARFANGGEIVENSVEYTPNGVIYSQVVQRALNAAKRRNAA